MYKELNEKEKCPVCSGEEIKQISNSVYYCKICKIQFKFGKRKS